MNGSGHRPLLFRWKLPPIGSNREEEPADRHESRRGELNPRPAPYQGAGVRALARLQLRNFMRSFYYYLNTHDSIEVRCVRRTVPRQARPIARGQILTQLDLFPKSTTAAV